MPKTYKNPILSGFYPDPSICRVAEDYYLVNSSFVYFPGLPVFHSRDLIHWEQIGHAINRPEQIDYSRASHSEGLWAPTIRHHNGKFYIINTLVFDGREAERVNYILTADDPAGPWSDPVVVQGADGIDSSLFFDDDGRIWYCGNFISREKQYPGHHGIYLCELDPATLQFKGERKVIWDGKWNHSKWIEGPHIYKINGMYYLLVAEGGTFTNHSVMMARCRTIEGDYEICPRNPIVSHRHLSLMHPIAVTGHADMVETQNGEWWMVLLGVRPYTGVQFNLGRETFLVPIIWEKDGWPRIDNDNGLVNEEERLPNLEPVCFPHASPNDNFENTTLDLKWNMIRSLTAGFYSLTGRKGYLRLFMRSESIADNFRTPSFIARRQQHKYFCAGTAMEFAPKTEAEEAGICLIQSNEFNYIYTVKVKKGRKYLTLSKHFNDAECVDCEYLDTNIIKVDMKEVELPAGSDRIYLYVQGECETYDFYYGLKEGEHLPFMLNADGTLLSTNVAGGFAGVYIGMYCSSNGTESDNYADFDWFEYCPF
jgi:xylan 1,4-beta-xylosidase